MTTTTTPAWPTQLLLPGQAAAPEGPVDMLMMYSPLPEPERDHRAGVRVAGLLQ